MSKLLQIDLCSVQSTFAIVTVVSCSRAFARASQVGASFYRKETIFTLNTSTSDLMYYHEIFRQAMSAGKICGSLVSLLN
jgi:hypothetical protein